MTYAKIVADSVNIYGGRLTTMELKFHRFILAEFNTHRVFSRSAASSRAIPTTRIISSVLTDPAMPSYWGKNQKGMQAAEELQGWRQKVTRGIYRGSAFVAAGEAFLLYKLGAHKHTTNRLLEPWMWAKVVVTATEWKNFFKLRDHKDAQPEFRDLAVMMKEALEKSNPFSLSRDQWHLPYVDAEDMPPRIVGDWITNAKIHSVARCARVSYDNMAGRRSNIREDKVLYEKLIGADPRHAGPTEHQAIASMAEEVPPELVSNFKGGWVQYRKLLETGVWNS